MEWLTREFTAIEKVRRNVVLLGSLAWLLAIFPVTNDEISLLGARFSSDVLPFAVFYALVFYTITLLVRTIIAVSLTSFERAHAEEQIDRQLVQFDQQHSRRAVEEIKAAIDEMEAQENAAHDQRVLERKERDVAWEKMSEEIRERRRQFEQEVTEGLGGEHRMAVVHEEIARCAAQEQHMRDQLARFRMQAAFEDNRPRQSKQKRRILAQMQRRASRRREAFAQQMPFANLIYGYVFLGEYLFPILFGVLSIYLLYQTHDISSLGALTRQEASTPN